MDKRLRAVLIIPYFGKVPDYFHLWLKSAEANPDFDFLYIQIYRFPSRNSPMSRSNIQHLNSLRER